MYTNIDKNKKPLICLALSLISYIAFLLLGLYFRPVSLANFLGCLALLLYMAIAPSVCGTVFSNTRGNKILVWLLKNRLSLSRQGLIISLYQVIAQLYLVTRVTQKVIYNALRDQLTIGNSINNLEYYKSFHRGN